MDKSTELDREEKTRDKLAVLPFMRPGGNTPSPANPSIPLDASNELDETAPDAPVVKLLADTATPSEANLNCESNQVDDSNLPARAPRLPVVGPAQLESRQQDRLQAIADYDHELEPVSLVQRITKFLSGWAASFIIHSLVLILLAVFSIRSLETKEASLTLTQPLTDELNAEAIDVKIDFNPDESNALQSELENDVVSDFSEDLTPATLEAPELEFELPLFDEGLTPIAGSGLTKGVGEGDGRPDAGGKKKGVAGESAGFFGAYAEGTDFIFVIDCSGSMHGERWARAVYELENSIIDLGEDQNFCIVLYNQFTAVMGDATRIEMVPRTDENLERAFTWLRNQQPGGGTFARQSLSLALAEQPDAIFLLSDGQIQDNSEAFLKANNLSMDNGIGEKRQIPVHTIALLSTFGQRTLKQIADNNEGTFTRVGR